jgi:hypothetical protein
MKDPNETTESNNQEALSSEEVALQSENEDTKLDAPPADLQAEPDESTSENLVDDDSSPTVATAATHSRSIHPNRPGNVVGNRVRPDAGDSRDVERPKYLRNDKTGDVFSYTEELARRKHMVALNSEDTIEHDAKLAAQAESEEDEAE